jgi:arabinan endo-1,5-alpha-L-arabinosidase
MTFSAIADTPSAPDPAIIAAPDGGGYYVFATGSGLPVFHSDDLRSWRAAYRVFDTPAPEWAREAVPGTGGIWAPDIAYFNGLYHLYYSVSTFGGQRSVVGLAVNKTLDPASPDFAWVDRGLVIESHPERDDFNAIDSALFFDDDGKAYLFWGSYWTGIKVRAIDPATGKPDPAHPEIVPVASRVGSGTSIEAAFVVKREGFYYMFVSWGSCCDGADSTYKVMVGRSANVLGPYADYRGRPLTEGGGTLVLANHGKWRGPGHNSVLITAAGAWMVHHTYDIERLEDKRVLQVRPLYWTAEGWPMVGEPLGETGASLVEAPTSPAGAWLHSVDYDDTGARRIVLRSDGAIGAADSPNTWVATESGIALQWRSDSAPGGAWTDDVILEPGGRSYIGRNQIGQVIRGVRE